MQPNALVLLLLEWSYLLLWEVSKGNKAYNNSETESGLKD